MFKLEKLEISGFKSFADRTHLLFGEGITAVVGPNGCGKSNISDSISWVLGEQSAKNLRGAKMEDVIFNGTRDRKPTGMAEVTLTLVAVADIHEQDSTDSSHDDESKFDQAVENAERAAYTVRALVEEMTPEESPAPDQQTAQIAATQTDDAAQPLDDNASAAVEQSHVSTPMLTVEGTAAESHPQTKKAERHRAPHMRKRKKVVISAGERVTIGRRLYRTGESDYLINGRTCLLRDIQDLFAGTGLGGAHYAIIEQGRIGQILSSKPLDRRALIEEAAGITKFKSRKRAAELRLESAKQNLTRLNDIISEIERQVNSLKRQAQKARRYRRLREEMRGLQKVVFTSDYFRLAESNERVARELEEAEACQHGLDSLLAERESEHQAVSAQARETEDQLTALRERAAAIELEADRARNRRAFEEQQISQLTARIQELERDRNAMEERLAILDAETERRMEDLKSLEQELLSEQSGLLARETHYQSELARLRQSEDEIERLRQQMLAEIGRLERARNLRANLEDAHRKIELRESSLKAERERAGAKLEEADAQHSQLSGEVEQSRTLLADLTHSITQRAAEIDHLRNRCGQLRSQLEATHSEREAANHRLASLEDLDAHHAYYSDAVQHVLSPEQAARINAMGTLADFVEVDAQYERLVESLLGRELQSVLVPTIDDALAGVEAIKSEQLGRMAFLVVGLHGGEGDPHFKDEKGFIETSDERREEETEETRFEEISLVRNSENAPMFELEVLRAIDLLGLRPEIRAVVERAFPDRCGAAVVPDIEAALQLSIENPLRVYVTSQGEQVVNGRLIVTASHTKGTSLLGLKREIKQLRVQTSLLGQEEQRLSAELCEAESRLAETEGESSTLDKELRQQEKDSAARDSQLEALQRDLDRARQHVRVVEAEMEQAASERADLEDRISQIVEELQKAEASEQQVQQALTQAQSSFAETRAEVERLTESLSSARASVAARAERLQAAKSEMRRITSEAEDIGSRINRSRLELFESHSRIEQLSASQMEGDSATARFETEKATLAGRIETLAQSLNLSRGRADELAASLTELRQQSSSAHDRRGQIEVERARVESEAEHLARTCFAELAMSLEDVVTSAQISGQLSVVSGQWSAVSEAQASPDASGDGEAGSDQRYASPPDPLTTDIESAKARLDELRVKIEEMGAVNMMALEELEEAEERFRFLSEQRRDILESIRLTEEALTEIKRRSRERFRHAFTHINENFQRMFVELFGGGRGEMILIDEDDVLESGIDLIAQPPGKRLQNVLLLSGGEKAMAAISLVLAIFQYRPSPFCILDEVDAPLDEMNVGRFSEKIIEMSSETQFLVITHNKRTMEAARALYGVTMEELGVSKLVSVKFE
jgi:chromosome segregation protein